MATHLTQRPLAADLPQNPLDIFRTLQDHNGTFWLDSGSEKSAHARYHFIGSQPSRWLRCTDEDAFGRLRSYLGRLAPHPATVVPAAQTVGYLSYELGRFIESIPIPAAATNHAEAVFASYDATITFDMDTKRTWITGLSEGACEGLERLLRLPPAAAFMGPLTTSAPNTATSSAEYEKKVDAVRSLIAAGDVYQVNLSHPFRTRLAPNAQPQDLYIRLREQHPAPYGAFFNAGETILASNSPEGFLDVDLSPKSRRVRTWPLKGTRPRSADPVELLHNEKERAEHVMIVDLERNDLGRIAVPGTVRVPQLLEIVTHSTVHHIESRVEAIPAEEVDLIDILKATFPGGSITGAPKIRAMEIIAELEQERRGPYCGAMGYVAFGGLRSHWSIPIRTAVIRGRQVTVRVGGGIVAESNPKREYQETLTKARAFLDVLSR